MMTLSNEQETHPGAWRAKAERLEKRVCELMVKNEMLRMALMAERDNFEGVGPDLDRPANMFGCKVANGGSSH
jgi:hypothetical protein